MWEKENEINDLKQRLIRWDLWLTQLKEQLDSSVENWDNEKSAIELWVRLNNDIEEVNKNLPMTSVHKSWKF